ncbi:hypothetical protein Mapa_012380 [Marchantia paleacea]|nr:hypothetical protein Mapa_012380 [Marchantia paleacea]
MVGATVAVTGANGFIASWLVKLLLERGYNVRGTVRDPDDVSKVGHLLDLPGAKERLVLYKADLLEEGVFDDIFHGVDGVFHTASPTTAKDVPDPQKNLLIPALKGTINVLTSAAKANSVKRVVLTSSNTAVTYSEAAYHNSATGVVVDESWWSDQEWCKKNQMWYPISKTQAELAAWDFAKEKNLDLVALNPSMVVGDFLQSSLNASSEVIFEFLNGSMKEYPNRNFGVVHVKDVALGHILVLENPSAHGRYLMIERNMQAKQFADIVRNACIGCSVPDKGSLNGQPFGAIYAADKMRNLGLVFTPAEEAVKDCVGALKAKNWITCNMRQCQC